LFSVKGEKMSNRKQKPTHNMPPRRLPKRLPITSPKVRHEIVKAALTAVQPPPHIPITERDKPFWDNVVSEFPTFEWTAHQLEIAALLARMMADLEENQNLLRLEGSVIETRNTVRVNPRVTAIGVLTSRILSFRRTLHLQAVNGSPQTAGKRKKLGKQIESTAIEALADDFIAQPDDD
jgi:hypothetical protein